MSNNSNSETSLFLTPFILILHFLSTPLFYSLFFPAGPVSPYRPILFGAESPSAWGIRDGSQPFRACAERRLSEVISHNICLSRESTPESPFLFFPDPAGSQGVVGGTN